MAENLYLFSGLAIVAASIVFLLAGLLMPFAVLHISGTVARMRKEQQAALKTIEGLVYTLTEQGKDRRGRYRVLGAMRETGEDTSIEVRAHDSEEAEEVASARGVLVRKVQTIKRPPV